MKLSYKQPWRWHVSFSAHLEFLHMRVSPGQAARYSHAEFARGPALRSALELLNSKAKSFSALATDHVRDFCARSMIEFCDTPTEVGTCKPRVFAKNSRMRWSA